MGRAAKGADWSGRLMGLLHTGMLDIDIALDAPARPPCCCALQGIHCKGARWFQRCDPQDIDIALDNLLGREFADRINEYLKAHVS